MRSNEGEQLVLALAPFVADLGESRRDDADRTRPAGQRIFDASGHVAGGQADDCEVGRLGQVGHRPVATNARDGVTCWIHRVHDAFELAGDDVPEEQAADRFSPPRGSEHRHARRREERPQRRDRREMVALVDTPQVGLGRLDPELDLDGSTVQLARALEADGLEDVKHLAVVRENLGDEALDPDHGGALGELLEHARADSAPLVVIGDHEGHLGRRRVTETDVAREGDHPAVQVAHQMAAFVPLGVDERRYELPVDRREAVEAVVEALLGKAVEELDQRVGVRRRRRAQPERRPVAEDDVAR